MSMSVSVVLVRSQPSGFTMSICSVKRTMDTMEPAQTPEEIRETLEGTQKGGVKNSIRNCLTVFQRDPLFRGFLPVSAPVPL